MTVALPTLTGLPPLCLLPLLVLPLPALRGLLLPAAGAVRHDVPDLATRPAPAVIRRGPVSQLRPVKEVILEQVNIKETFNTEVRCQPEWCDSQEVCDEWGDQTDSSR